MSYILDALRKSERERQQVETVVLAPNPADAIELPRRRVAPWAGAAAIIVSAIAGAAYWFTLRAPAPAARPTEPIASVPIMKPASAPDSAPMRAERAAPSAEAPPLASSAAPPALKSHPLAPAPDDEAVRDLAAEAQVEVRKPKRAPLPRNENAQVPVASAPATPPESEGVKFLRSMPPDFQRALPELVVNIHIYAPREADRILYINNRQYHAGDRVRDDIVVEDIVQDGAVLSFRGQRFKLPRPS